MATIAQLPCPTEQMMFPSGVTAEQVHTTVPLSVVCKADCLYSKLESPRLLEERVRALHTKLSEEARKREGFDSHFPVVTFVNPLQDDCRPCKAPRRHETRHTTSTKSSLPRTCSLPQLPSLDNTVESSNTDDLEVEENSWAYQVKDRVQESTIGSGTLYGKLMDFLLGSSGDAALP